MHASDFLVKPGEALNTAVARAINAEYLGDETRIVRRSADIARLDAADAQRVRTGAQDLVNDVRSARRAQSGLDAFLREYDLGSKEGVVLMCLAEALLRIPDSNTADKLIAEKISAGDWAGRVGDSSSLFVNASTWGLMLTGRIVLPEEEHTRDPASFLARLVARIGEPVVRTALRQAMRILGAQFVMGRNIEEAIRRARDADNRAYRHSFDMLGEGALTQAGAEKYFTAYRNAIEAVAGGYPDAAGPDRASISVKLSALHPRYERAQRERVHRELTPRIIELAEIAAQRGVALTIDAEESERLELSLEIIAAVMQARQLHGWEGFGLAMQAYQRRALDVVDWLVALAQQTRRRLNVRLVKGAYWDSEIKRGQERGLDGYPVFTRKVNTDVSYLACARKLFGSDPNLIYPQFATHNAHTVAYVLTLARQSPARAFEFQRLHGMGEELYAQIVEGNTRRAPCRVYAPVGSHEELLPYLVRRLLENGANTSFVNRIVDERLPAAEVARDPIDEVDKLEQIPHPRIVAPRHMFGAERMNSGGLNLADPQVLESFRSEAASAIERSFSAAPLVARRRSSGPARVQTNPANSEDRVGGVSDAGDKDVAAALNNAAAAQADWDATDASIRAAALRKCADMFEARRADLMTLCMREAGKTVNDALAEVREAVDFLRYYAADGQRQFGARTVLPGPTGESNELALHGRGVFACISPWNFPLAIFTGQVSAALAAGNSVIAKPAEQTPLIATLAVQMLHESGIPAEVLSLLPGDGATVGKALLADERVAGVAFTGSNDTAQIINRQLAARSGAIATLIAETGGQNVMLVDSSALPEQVVLDAVGSAFNSAGQRCSALRVLLVQEDIADRVIELLRGYMDELIVGDPALLATDVGPVIDADARKMLEDHLARMQGVARWVHRSPIQKSVAQGGFFFAPAALEIDSLTTLQREVFGPVMHVLRYRARDLDQVLDSVNALGFGLTLGVHTRIESTARRIAARARVGNVYVNRNMVGAVVGVQPFGGCGLSGTGPKAGGPHYLARFATERTITINTAAVGGNTSLLAMESN